MDRLSEFSDALSAPRQPRERLAAIEAFERVNILEPHLGPLFRRAFADGKRQERVVVERRAMIQNAACPV